MRKKKLKVAEMRAIIIGIYEGKGRFKNTLGRLLVKLPDGRERLVGTGFTEEERNYVFANKTKFMGTAVYVRVPPLPAQVCFKNFSSLDEPNGNAKPERSEKRMSELRVPYDLCKATHEALEKSSTPLSEILDTAFDKTLNAEQDSKEPIELNIIKGVNEVLAERQGTHGDFVEQSDISFSLKNIIRQASGYSRLESYEAECLDMILHKISRAVCGDPHFLDHWVDIQGYAKLTEKAIRRSKD